MTYRFAWLAADWLALGKAEEFNPRLRPDLRRWPVQIGIPRVTPPVQLDTGVVAPCGSASGWPLCSSAPPRWPRGRLGTGWRRVVPLVTGWPRAAPSVALPAGTLRGHSRGALPVGHFQGGTPSGHSQGGTSRGWHLVAPPGATLQSEDSPSLLVWVSSESPE